MSGVNRKWVAARTLEAAGIAASLGAVVTMPADINHALWWTLVVVGFASIVAGWFFSRHGGNRTPGCPWRTWSMTSATLYAVILAAGIHCIADNYLAQLFAWAVSASMAACSVEAAWKKRPVATVAYAAFIFSAVAVSAGASTMLVGAGVLFGAMIWVVIASK